MDRRGQLVAVIPLSISLAIGGLLMWGYQNTSRNVTAGIRARVEGDRFANLAINRLRLLATRPLPTSGTCASLATTLGDMRNLAMDDVAPSTLTYTFGVGVPGWVDCLFTADERSALTDSTYGPLESLSLNLSRLGKPDLETFTVFLTVTAQAVTRQIDSAPVRSFTLRENVRLQAASLARYAVVLRHPTQDSTTAGAGVGVTAPQLTVGGTAGMEVLGDVYRAGDRGASTTLGDIVALGNQPNIAIHGRLDVQADRLTIPITSALDLTAMNGILHKGIREKIFSQSQLLPIQDGVPGAFTPNANGAWNHYINYPVDPLRRSQAIGYVRHYAADAVGVPAYDPSEQFSTATPSAPPVDTCDTSGTNRFAYVHINFDLDLTLNEAHFGTMNSFCGFVAVNTLTVNVGAASNKLFLGQIIARKIVVNGARTLFIANPADNVAVASPSPAPDPAEIFRQFQEISLIHGHNFNVPVLLNPAALGGAQFEPFRPHGAMADASVWVGGTLGATPIPNTYPPAGYMVRCEDDGVTPLMFCPRLNLPPAPLTKAAREAALAAGLAAQMVFE